MTDPKASDPGGPPESEVLDVLTKPETTALERSALKHYRAASRNLILFAAELRQLQDGQAHNVRGFQRFDEYAAAKFPGLSPDATRQMTRAGAVALALHAAGRIDLKTLDVAGGANPIIETTALRQLATVLNKHGEAQMLQVYETARGVRPPENNPTVQGRDVSQAIKALGIPTRTVRQEDDQAPEDFEYDAEGVPDLEDDEPEEVGDLLHAFDVVRQEMDDLRLATGDPLAVRARWASILEGLAEIREILAERHPDVDLGSALQVMWTPVEHPDPEAPTPEPAKQPAKPFGARTRLHIGDELVPKPRARAAKGEVGGSVRQVHNGDHAVEVTWVTGGVETRKVAALAKTHNARRDV